MSEPLFIRSCKYKDLFGVPGKGFHATRFFGVALYDVIGTFGLALLFSLLTKISYIWSLVFMFGAGVVLHWLFCVNTTINTKLGLSSNVDK